MTELERAVVKIAQMKVVRQKSGSLITHALGSCIGVTIFDPVAHVAGLLHFMLPSPNKREGGSTLDIGPYPYCSSAVPELFRAAYKLGAEKERLIVCAAGGAELIQKAEGQRSDARIGTRNRTMLRKLLWSNNLVLAGEETGGNVSRNLSIDLADGSVRTSTAGQSHLLWKAQTVEVRD